MSRSLTDWRPQRVVVGAVGKAHGLDGATHLVGYGGVVPIAPGTEVLIGDRPAVVVERKGTHDRPIVSSVLPSRGSRESATTTR